MEPKYRWKNGLGYQNNEYFFRAIQKYGWNNFEHKILLKNLTEEQASCLERFFISYWNLNNKEYGYNLTSGGSKGYTQSQKTKDKISNSNTGKVFTEEHKKKLSENAKKRTGDKNPFYGKHHSLETKKKLSKINSGKKHTEEAKRKMSISRIGKTLSKETIKKMIEHRNKKAVKQIDANTNEIINIFPYVAEAERQTGVIHIRDCCKGRRKYAGGFRWEYVE